MNRAKGSPSLGDLNTIAARGVVLEAANLHLPLAEIHAVMAQAFTALGQADSARAHSAWQRASRQ